MSAVESGDVRVDSRLGEMQSPSALHVAEAAGQVVRSRRGHVVLVARIDFVAAVHRREVRDHVRRTRLVDVGRRHANLVGGHDRHFGGDADHRRQSGQARMILSVCKGRNRRIFRNIDTSRRRRGRSQGHQKGQRDQRVSHSSHRHRLAEGLQIQ